VTLDCLLADGPDPALADRLALFGQFVGSWDLEVSNYDADGREDRRPGEWHFGWVLDGLAVQDVWITPSRAHRARTGAPRGEYGTSVRFYDPSIDAWRSTWIGPGHRLVAAFIARPTPEGILLETTREDGERWRWSFSEIDSTSFRWHNRHAVAGSDDWVLVQEFWATRAGSPSVANT
jgi:hypothetical protein